jgi:hypothetical protein
MNRKSLALISLVIVFAMLFAFSGCTFTSEGETTTTTVTAKTPLPTDITSSYDEESNIVTDTEYSPEDLVKNTQTIFEYFDVHINELKTQKAAVNMSVSKSTGKATDENGEELPISDNDYVNVAITNLDNLMLNTTGDSIDYGEDLTKFLPIKGENYVSKLTLDEVESATCVDNGATRTITITLKSPSLPTTIEKAYDMGNIDVIMAEFEKANAYMTAEKPTLTYKNCQIILTANVETDEITAIEYIKTIDVSTTVTGEGELSSIGTVPVNFNYRSSVKYDIDHSDPATATTLAEK